MLRIRSPRTIRITESCARMCMVRFGIGDVDSAAAFLTRTLEERGAVVRALPSRFVGAESPSGRFAFVDGLFALCLVNDETAPRRWAAVNCLPDPGHRPDPADDTATGVAAARRVELSGQAIARFQYSCGGDPDTVVAARQLRDLLDRTARLPAQPPPWSRVGSADLVLVAGAREEYVIPCQRRPGGGYTALTVVVRDGDLFDLDARGLLGRCRIDDGALPVGSVPALLFDWLMRTRVQLVRDRPHWAPRIPQATWWIVALPETRRVAAAVAFHPGTARPLIVVAVVDARIWPVRFAWLLLNRDV